MKKKTVYNIIMVAVIAAIAAVAVLLVGRHLGWFDKAAPEGEATAISATVRKGLANLERGGIASELKGQTQLRQGDVISVASGYVAVEADTGSLMLSQGSQLEIVSAAEAQVRLVTGEAFCQVGDKPVKLQYGEHNATLQNTVLVCTVRTGSETVYVLGGTVSDGGEHLYRRENRLLCRPGALCAGYGSAGPELLCPELRFGLRGEHLLLGR